MYYALILTVMIGAGQLFAFHPNDDCSSALPLSIPSSGVFNGSGASPDALIPCGQATPFNGIWFSVVGDGTTL
ncbi:MAG: hypothetical protein KDB65_09375 [Calditrichaeota bacterium]|nr:hypothetical protein [Calditrichota bacterium]MCB9369398.1 hypothetical protein [Calditrichota bacterium]